MKRETLKSLIYLLLLMVVAPVMMKAYDERWWIRDPERLCRMALYELNATQYSRSKVLWRRATKLRPDWFVPYVGLLACEEERSDRDDWLDWLCGHLPEPIDWPFLRWADKRSSSETRRDERILRQACRLVEDPVILFGVWKKDPEAAEFFARGYHEWKAKRYDASARFFEQGLSRSPTYPTAYFMLIKVCAWGGFPERATDKLLDLSPSSLQSMGNWVKFDEEDVNRLRSVRPAAWTLHFENYHQTEAGWRLGIGRPVAHAHLVAASKGSVWVLPLRSPRDPCYVWRLRKEVWKEYPVKGVAMDIMSLREDSAWVTLAPESTQSLPVNVLRSGAFVPLIAWQLPVRIRNGLVWRNETWIGSELGLLRHAHDEWSIYPLHSVKIRGRSAVLRNRSYRLPKSLRVVNPTGMTPDPYEGERYLCTDSRGRLWYGEHVFDGQKFRPVTGSLLDWRRRCWIDSDWRLWGAEEGSWGAKRWLPVDVWGLGKLPPGIVDRRGRVWFGVCRLTMWDGRQLMVWNKDDGLEGDWIHSLALDGNTLWIGTDRGVSRTTIPN